jgi:hypothetical protein
MLPQTLIYPLKRNFGFKPLLCNQYMNLSCNNFYLNFNIGIVLMCFDCVLASPRIAQVDPGEGPLPKVVLSQLVAKQT